MYGAIFAVVTVVVHTSIEPVVPAETNESVGSAETYGTIVAVVAVVVDTSVEPVVPAETYEHAESVD